MNETVERIKREKITPQRLGVLKERLSLSGKFVDWHNTGYETNWLCLNCESDDQTIMEQPNTIKCLKCNIFDHIPLLGD